MTYDETWDEGPARRQETPRRWMAKRRLSMLSTRGVQPRWWHTSASSFRVHVLRCLPHRRPDCQAKSGVKTMMPGVPSKTEFPDQVF